MISFQDLVDGLNEELGLDMTIDKHKAVKLILDGTITLQLEMHNFQEAYCLISPIEQLHQGMHREAVLKSALKSNHTFRPKGGHFGFVEKKGFLLLFCYIPFSIASVREVLLRMISFTKQVRSWKEALASGLNGPQGAFKEPLNQRNFLYNKNFVKP